MTDYRVRALGSASPRPLPKPGHVDVWYFDSASLAPDDLAALERTLPEMHREAAGRFRNELLRTSFVINMTMPLAVLRSYIDQDTTGIVFDLGRCGKPRIFAPDAARRIRHNVAHTGTMSVVAVTSGAEVGIDIERIREDVAIGDVASLCFSERELAELSWICEADRVPAFFACWTRKEALLKAQGTGLTRPPATADVGFGAYEPIKGRSSERAWDGWSLAAFHVGPDYAGAVAIEGAEIHLSTRKWHLWDADDLRHSG